MKHRNLFFALTITILLIVSGCASTTPLIKASTKGDALAVQKLLDEGANVNEPDSYGTTPLMHAIQYQNIETIESLIKKGANINVKDKYGNTALHYAAYSSNYKIIKLLIDIEADVNVKDVGGTTPLDACVSNYEGAKLLIDNGANINAQDKTGLTALHYIAQTYNDKNALMVAEYLLSKNADTTLKDENGWTALRLAIYSKNVDIIALIRKKTNWSEGIESLSMDEALRSASYYKPESNMFDVPADKERAYKLAVTDCNLIIIPNKTGLLLVTGPVGYVAGIAVDSVTIKGKFQSCMAKMGFECKNNCSN